MAPTCALTRLSTALSEAADSSGRVHISTLRALGFDDDTIRRDGPDAVRLTLTREVTSLHVEIVRG